MGDGNAGRWLVDARYAEERFTVVTTNQDLDEIRKLSHGRIYSRLVEMCYMIPMQGIDYRQHMQTVQREKTLTRRTDGREVDQLRSISIELDYINTSPWGCFAVDGTDKGALHRQLRGSGATLSSWCWHGMVNRGICDVTRVFPSARSREGATGKVNSRSREIQRLIGRSLRAAVDLEKAG